MTVITLIKVYFPKTPFGNVIHKSQFPKIWRPRVKVKAIEILGPRRGPDGLKLRRDLLNKTYKTHTKKY